MKMTLMLPSVLTAGLCLAGETVVENGVPVAYSEASAAVAVDTRICVSAPAPVARPADTRTTVSAESSPVAVNADKRIGFVTRVR